jgi:hypothetical protein
VGVSWQAQSVHPEGHPLFAAQAPRITVEELVLSDGALRPAASWEVTGTLALYEVTGDRRSDVVTLPQVALEEAISVAMRSTRPVVWHGEPDLVEVPVVLAADDELQRFYGARWTALATARVRHASVLLEQAGIALRVLGTETWESDDEANGLTALLDGLSAEPRSHPGAIRIGFTQQTELARHWSDANEDVGRAYVPGADVVIADQPAVPAHLDEWDRTEEAIAVAHEVLHALGVPHRRDADWLMSGTKRSPVHRIHPDTRTLARVAADARFRHWDPEVAAESLASAAEDLLGEPDLQVSFVKDNLALGVGVPAPGAVSPTRLSALTNVAIGRFYLEQAALDPARAASLRERAIEHSAAAMAQRPAYGEAQRLLRDAQGVHRPETLDDPKVCEVPEAPEPDPVCERPHP